MDDDDCQVAFGRIKKCLMNPPMLMPPVPGRPLILYMTVLDKSMGCMLGQHDDSGKREQDVLCLSEGSPSSKAVHAKPHHLAGIQDGPSQVHFRKVRSHRMDRSVAGSVSEFDIVYVTQKAIKGSALVDYLAQQPLNDYQPMHPEFLDEDIMALFEEEVEDEDRDK
ncbi:uncharacterized protein LOC114374261 [Glycine soja]|uniref:uncharacterized protein LOC114374261 n=1 Tax=Glycine soja TaxID=3848 RepID=UPI00103F252E|nr:uncharacterized protein LOC114374261 [Glycine soja]